MSQTILQATYTSLERVVGDYLRALDGIPDDDLNAWKPAAEHNGGGEMNTLAALSVHVVQAGAWRIVHQVFGHDYPRDRESEFTATASRAEIDAMFNTMLRRFAGLIQAQPDVDLTAMPPTLRESSPDWTKLQYLVSLVEHTSLHLGHAQITRQLWLSERGRPFRVTDRLGVRTSCKAVVRGSRHVRIDNDAIVRLAHDLRDDDAAPEWDTDLHYRATGENADEHTAMWLLVLDTLNFCFWSDDPARRWRVNWHGELVDGYIALVAALTTAVEAGYPVHDVRWLATVSEQDVAAILQPAQGHTTIPLFQHRVANLRELGTALLAYGPNPASAFISAAGGNAIRLVQQVVERFSSFNDVTMWPYGETGLTANEVRFYKRAQILVGDLAGGLAGSPLAEFAGLDQLTAFADYKVPQLLRWLGVLVYDEALTTTVDTRTRIAAGSRMEIEIRAATIVACDRIVAALANQGQFITATELDWLLWSRSQSLPGRIAPYHLTETIFY